jgi:exopolysaccharide biosynthesis polyprenyl glycosylphosphotransferase
VTDPEIGHTPEWSTHSSDGLREVVRGRTLEVIDHRRRGTVPRRRGWLVRRALVLADVLGLSLAFVAAELLFQRTATTSGPVHPWLEGLVFALTLPVWVVTGRLYGLYKHDEERNDHTTVDDLAGIFQFITIGAWIFFMSSSLTDATALNVRKLLIFWLLAIVLVVAGRVIARSLCRQRVTYIQNAVIVGAGEVGQRLAQKFLQHPEYGVNLVGFVDDRPKDQQEGLEQLSILGPPSALKDIVRLLDIDRVIVAFSNDSHEQTIEVVRSLGDFYIQVDIVPRLFEILSPSTAIHTVEGIPLIGLPPFHLSRSSRLLKRAMDICVSTVLLTLSAPLLVYLALRIKLDSPGPVLFRQLRIGVGDRTFTMLKFRTMCADAEGRKEELAHLNRHARRGGDARMFKVPDDPRVTRFGRTLRRYTLDELPQLWNVLTGDMSIVGPRPLPADQVAAHADLLAPRQAVPAGVTGWWQINGRSRVTAEEALRLDLFYIENWSPSLDLYILLKTFGAVVAGRGAH